LETYSNYFTAKKKHQKSVKITASSSLETLIFCGPLYNLEFITHVEIYRLWFLCSAWSRITCTLRKGSPANELHLLPKKDELELKREKQLVCNEYFGWASGNCQKNGYIARLPKNYSLILKFNNKKSNEMHQNLRLLFYVCACACLFVVVFKKSNN